MLFRSLVAPESHLWVTTGEKTVEEMPMTVTTPWNENVVRYFAEVIAGTKPNIAGIADSHAAMDAIARAQASVADGTTH